MSTAIPASVSSEKLIIAGRAFSSRLIIGTGKYRSYDEMRSAHEASGAEMVTVAVRRVPLDRSTESFLDHLSPTLQILPNTAGCYTADDAVRTARLARETSGSYSIVRGVAACGVWKNLKRGTQVVEKRLCAPIERHAPHRNCHHLCSRRLMRAAHLVVAA